MPEPRKSEGLDVHEVKDGFIIYDQGSDRVHYLNPTAAVIFELCDGTRDVDALAASVAEAFGLETPPVDEVRESVQQFLAERLVRV